jgi:hypothetical protein
MPKPIHASPPLADVAAAWASRAHAAYEARDVDEALRCARRAVQGAQAFNGKRWQEVPGIRGCLRLIEKYGTEPTTD